MIISSSSIGMDSARTYTSVSMEASFVRAGNAFTSFYNTLSSDSSDNFIKNETAGDDNNKSLSYDKSKNDFDSIFDKMRSSSISRIQNDKFQLDAMNHIRVKCIQYLLSLLFGTKYDSENITTNSSASANENTTENENSGNIQPLTLTSSENYFSYSEETEETSFSTTGSVITSDGREISFNLDLSMSRSFTSFYAKTDNTVRAFIDPLVINFDADIADVSDVKIKFDLNADGTEESISRLSSGSGYLALDLNEDGIINDGSELFGTTSGDGFSDLAKYDSDNNGWIDEADDVFNKLKICVTNEDGSQSLYNLSDKGVGAICLNSADTDFSLNNLQTNDTNARIRRTGIFLYENGGVGTVQHLDLAQ